MQDVNFSIETRQSADELLQGTGAYTLLFKKILEKAKRMGASDLHFEPHKEGIKVRARVLGDLQTWESLPLKHQQSFLVQVKQLTEMSIAIRGKSQDTKVAYPSLGIELRGSSVPTEYDDKLVFRVINVEDLPELPALGFPYHIVSTLKNLTELKSGLVLISGPTGSGKSNSIYALLNSIDSRLKNVVTLEDPIERTLSYATQIKISKNFSFAQGLRACMRQDPDVIVVGEIRDSETAELAVEAANTGHLVISTIHANDSFAVINRLLNLGVDKDLLKETLCFSSAQRLVPLLCQNCKLEVPKELYSGHSLYQRSDIGCRECADKGKGVIGRRPVLEFLNSDQIKQVLLEGDSKLRGEIPSLKYHITKLVHEGNVCASELGGYDV